MRGKWEKVRKGKKRRERWNFDRVKSGEVDKVQGPDVGEIEKTKYKRIGWLEKKKTPSTWL